MDKGPLSLGDLGQFRLTVGQGAGQPRGLPGDVGRGR